VRRSTVQLGYPLVIQPAKHAPDGILHAAIV
jgi:hypothetical protein